MPEQSFDIGDVIYDAGAFTSKQGQRKPSLAQKKIHVDAAGKVTVGVTLLDAMLESAGIDRQAIEQQAKTKQNVKVVCSIGSKRRGGTGQYAKYDQPFLIMQIWETEAEAKKELPKDFAGEIKTLHFHRRHYINVNLMRNYHDQYKGTHAFQPFLFDSVEDRPIGKVDPPVQVTKYDKKKKEGVPTGEVIEEYHVTRTDFTFDTAVDLDTNTGSIRIWGNEGQYMHHPLGHQPYDPENRSKSSK